VAKNRQILLAFNPSGKAKKHRDQLLKKGLDLENFTHIYATKTETNTDFVTTML